MTEREIKQLEGLVERVKQRDEDAFAEIYNSMHNKIYFFALSIVKERHLAEDVVQEVFLVVYQSIDSLKNNRLFTAWVNRITYRTAINLIKKTGEIPLLDEVLEREASNYMEEEVLTTITKKETTRELFQLIVKLPANLSTVIIMRYYNNFSLTDIAAMMDCPVGTIKSRLNTAKKRLHKDLDRRRVLFLPVGTLLFLACRGETCAAFAMETEAANQCFSQISSQLGLETQNTAPRTLGQFGGNGVGWLPIVIMASGIGVGCGLLALHPKIYEPQIEISTATEKYGNEPVDIWIQVQDIQPGSFFTVEYNGRNLPVWSNNLESRYEAVAEKNGTYTAVITTLAGARVEKSIEISQIDQQEPEILSNEYDEETKTATITVGDNASGVNMEQTFFIDRNGDLWTQWKAEENTILVDPFQEDLRLYLYDFANNLSIFEIIFKNQ